MNFITKFFTDYQPLLKLTFFTLLTIGGIVINYAVSSISFFQTQSELKAIRSETVSKRLDGFGGTLAAFRDEAYRVEIENKQMAERIELLLDCIERSDCKRYPFLLKRKPYEPVNIMKAYQPIRELLGKAEENAKEVK